MTRGEFPSVLQDALFGEVTAACWHGEYVSIAAVEQDILSRLGRSPVKEGALRQAAVEEMAAQYVMLRAECEEFVVKQARARNRNSC